jgi:succinyl-CoA synthetase beta subunit
LNQLKGFGPIVVRLEGTNAQQGLALLSGSKYNIYTEANLTQAWTNQG